MALGAKALPAVRVGTVIGFLPCVYPEVSLEISLLTESLAALLAHKWFMSSVFSEVDCQPGCLGVALVATRICARVILYGRVLLSVVSEVVLIRELAVAAGVRALPGFVLRVVLGMLEELRKVIKGFSAGGRRTRIFLC